MVELERMDVQQILADTTNTIAEGEVLQLLHVRNPDTDEAAYLRVIERKTAILFAAATTGRTACGRGHRHLDALHRYGLALGYAFQIADDVLDYASDAATLGKNLGDDWPGKMTPAVDPCDGAQRRCRTRGTAQDRRARRPRQLPTVQAAIGNAAAARTTAANAPCSTRAMPKPHCLHCRRTRSSPRCAGWRSIRSAATIDACGSGRGPRLRFRKTGRGQGPLTCTETLAEERIIRDARLAARSL